VEIVVDRRTLEATVDLVGTGSDVRGAGWGARELEARPLNPVVMPHPELPDDTRLWAALQEAGGGTWAGCVYDANAIVAALERGKRTADN